MNKERDPPESTRIFLRYSLTVIFIYWCVTTFAGGFFRSTLQTLFSINALYAVVLALLVDVALALYYRFELHQRRDRIHLYKIATDALIIPAVLLSRSLADSYGGSIFGALHYLTLVTALAMFLITAITLLWFMWKR